MRPPLPTLAVLLFLPLLHLASAQAPGDESDGCDISGDPTEKVLLYSRGYDHLIGAEGVWETLNIDSTGAGWAVNIGGNCQRTVRICDYREVTAQNNWLFTQYISYLDASEVFVTLSVTMAECISNRPACGRLILDVLQFETNQQSDAQQIITTNYSPEYVVNVLVSETSTVTREFRFTNSGIFNGFYLAFRDTQGGTCANLNSLRVYYRICPGRVDGLVTYPEIGLPVEGASAPIVGSAVCASNSSPTSSLVLSAFANGTCAGNPSCECDPGYEYVVPVGGPAMCQACTPNTYKATTSNTVMCQDCPAFSESDRVAEVECPCQFDFTRPAGRPDSACSKPPSSPRVDLSNLPSVTGNAANLCWLASEDPGGQPDLHYNVYVSGNRSNIFVKSNSAAITDVCYTVTGLDLSTSYLLVVVAANGATNDPDTFTDVSVVQDRFVLFFIATGDEIIRCPQCGNDGGNGGSCSCTDEILATFFTLFAVIVLTAVSVFVLSWFYFIRCRTPKQSTHIEKPVRATSNDTYSVVFKSGKAIPTTEETDDGAKVFKPAVQPSPGQRAPPSAPAGARAPPPRPPVRPGLPPKPLKPKV